MGGIKRVCVHVCYIETWKGGKCYYNVCVSECACTVSLSV